MRKQALTLAAITLFSTTLWAQQVIQGKVSSNNNAPLPKAIITALPSKTKTITNADGSFTVNTKAGDTAIVVNHIGFGSKTINLSNSSALSNIVLTATVSQIDEVVVIGNRRAQRSVYNSTTPVDVIRISDYTTQVPQAGVNELLQQFVPSFNALKQSASDGTEHIDPISLRGLGPDQVLVLINGKRRHTTSLINYQNTVGNGAVGTDMNSIPTSAIEKIEVLRDGASAQYGSDAIAGVVNIILKKNKGFTAGLTTGVTGRGDGESINFNANYGFGFAKDKGFVNITFESNNRGATNRTQNHDLIIFDQSAQGNFFAYAFANNPAAARAFDDAQLAARGLTRDDFNFRVGDAQSLNQQLFVNAGYKVNASTELYVTAGASYRNGKGFGFRRLPSETSNVITALHPNGFQPTLNSVVGDYSLIAGIRKSIGDWKLDFSNTIGNNNFAYEVNNSNNSSLGNNSPINFKAGSHAFTQNTTNFDVSRTFTQANRVLNLAFGGEYRWEQYQIKAGDEASWRLYNNNPNGVAGVQSFPGFSPANAIKADRSSVALYADADWSFNNKLIVALAGRFENYTDFGNTLNGKLALRYNFSNSFALRGALSTGFRAPSLHQQYFSNFYSDIAQNGGGIVNKGIFNGSSAAAKALGLPALQEETSVNYSVGFTTKPAKNLVITADAYLIDIKDRIVITSSITDPRITALGVESGRFFTNAIDTRTVGVDVVANYQIPISAKQRFDIALAANFNRTEIRDRHFPTSLNNIDPNQYFGPDQRSLIETNFPQAKHTLTVNYTLQAFTFTVRNTYWGVVTRDGFPFGIVQDHKPKVTTDIAAAYTLKKNTTLTLGVNNLLDVFPDVQAYENSYFGVFKYAPVQMGVAGNYFYTRITYTLP